MALPLDLTDPATWTLLPGFSSFAKPDAGGGDDDEFDIGDDDEDEPDDEDDDADEKDGEKDDDADEEKLPDSVKAILRKNRSALRAADKRARVAEAKLRDQGKGKKPAKPKDEDADDEETKLAEAETRGAEKATQIAKVATAKAALKSAGLVVGDDPATSYKKALRVLDLDSLDIDEDGEIEGLEDALVELREDFPSMFSRKRARRGVNGDDDKGRTPAKKKLSASERQAAALGRGK